MSEERGNGPYEDDCLPLDGTSQEAAIPAKRKRRELNRAQKAAIDTVAIVILFSAAIGLALVFIAMLEFVSKHFGVFGLFTALGSLLVVAIYAFCYMDAGVTRRE